MKLHNEFVVPLPPKQAFEVLNDVERVAPCFPGAKLLGTNEDGSFNGSVSLRLGPVALSFQGTARFEEVDATALRVKAKANGDEKRARGAARADVEFQVVPDDAGSRVLIDTELLLVGSIAQYARGAGMIEATAQVMIDGFAKNLQASLVEGAAAAPAVAPAEGGAASPSDAAAKAGAPARQAPEVAPPSLFAILWLALKKRLFGGAGR